MKLSLKLSLAFQLAVTVVCEYMPTHIPDYSNFSPENTPDLVYLNGTEALNYLFKYDPSRPHQFDFPYKEDLWDKSANATYISWSYDTNYIRRMCSPRSWSGEAEEAVNISTEGIPADTDRMEWEMRYEYAAEYMREKYSSSPYPCERTNWITTECGINPFLFPSRNGKSQEGESKGTPQEQNACLCASDYWAAADACMSCVVLHTGNQTLGEEDKSRNRAASDAICGESATVTKSFLEYWSSAYPESNANTTIISDGAQNKTDVSLYYTGGVDFVPATIREPAFTRTVSGKEVTMTPGPLAARATAAKTEAAGTEGSSTGSAGAAATSAGGAASMGAPIGAMAGVFGVVLML